MNELVGSGLILINYTDHDIHASVHYNNSLDPEDGASAGMGPHAGGGGLVCCISVPTIWRPGIKMTVWYSTKDWQKESGETKIIELPEYPDGKPGPLFLIFHKDTELELFSSMFGPGHPRWPGRQVEPVIEGIE